MSQGHQGHLSIDIPKLPPHRVCGWDFFLLEFPWGPYNSQENWLYCSGRHTLVRLVKLVLQATPRPHFLPLTPAVALVLMTHELVWAEVTNPSSLGLQTSGRELWWQWASLGSLCCWATHHQMPVSALPSLLNMAKNFYLARVRGLLGFFKKMRYLGIPSSCKYTKSTWGKMILNNSLWYWWRRAWQPTSVFLPRESHGQRATAHAITKSQTCLKQLSTAHMILK